MRPGKANRRWRGLRSGGTGHPGRAASGATLNNWILDAEKGYLLAPMQRGIRLTPGAEFAAHTAPQTTIQLDGAERVARALFPLGDRVDPKPWMGARPCTPDMKPIIGPAPRHRGLWLAIGHAHRGLTLGPVTGRLLAEQITGRNRFSISLHLQQPGSQVSKLPPATATLGWAPRR